MDEDTTIINSSTRNEKIRNFIKNNKKFLISMTAFIVILLITYFAFKEYQEQKK